MKKEDFKWNDQKFIKAFLVAHTCGWTAGEIEHKINRPGSHRRLSEMERMGLVKRVGKRKCTVTGKNRDLWFDDDSPPRPKPIKSPLVHENRKLKDRIAYLEAQLQIAQSLERVDILNAPIN